MARRSFALLWCCFVFVLRCSAAAGGIKKAEDAFSLIKSLPEGELQRIVRWNEVCAREVLVDWG